MRHAVNLVTAYRINAVGRCTYATTARAGRTLKKRDICIVCWDSVGSGDQCTLASSPGHSQFLMLHAGNGRAWDAKSRAPRLGGRVIIVRGPETSGSAPLELGQDQVLPPIATDHSRTGLAIAAQQ